MTTTTTRQTTVVLPRKFTTPGDDVFDSVEWERRTASVGSFEQEGVEFPCSWTQNATNIVAQKYFRGQMGSPEREYSVRQMVGRVADTIRDWGVQQGYFRSSRVENPEAADAFRDELAYILLHQVAAFNSPVWFNVGFEEEPQCSACFILSVQDTLADILDWNTREGRIFQGGSGSGTSLSALRGENELLRKGGNASGPVSFMRGADAWAGTISSGGKTRRAAKMVTLACDHPDIRKFITCKALEEERLAVLRAAGLIHNMDETAAVGSYQNANNSVRVTEAFMRKAVGEEGDPSWPLLARSPHTPGMILEIEDAAQLLDEMAKAAWRCACPGIQFDTLINDWHTSPASGRINASNPCSEYMHVDDSACNLASINLMKFRNPDGHFDAEMFQHVVNVMTTAMDILVESASYPTDTIKKNAHNHHQLGLGYCNLGALLMSLGLPYDSSQGRDLAAAITSLMTGQTYAQGAKLAEAMGPYPAWEWDDAPVGGPELSNASAHMRVLKMHSSAAETLRLRTTGTTQDIASRASDAWSTAQARTAEHGQRIAQATLLAPTGTISFLMDCDTTGMEPCFSLVQYKDLAGGGSMVLINKSVELALRHIGVYTELDIQNALQALRTPDLDAFKKIVSPHTDVFAGANEISPKGHIKMMGAVQPFISGAISKTVNMAESSTIEDVKAAYVLAWKEGVKALAIYRDGSKGAAPLSTTVKVNDAQTAPTATRRRLPVERQSITHKFQIGGSFEGYITAGMYPDGTLGEIFLNDIGKDGSTLLGMTNAFATEVSTGIQYGKPIEEVVMKHANRTFEPRGMTRNPEIPICSSIVDYMARWVASRFCSAEIQLQLGLRTPAAIALEAKLSEATDAVVAKPRPSIHGDQGPACDQCGAMMNRTGACYTCRSCGNNTGCG